MKRFIRVYGSGSGSVRHPDFKVCLVRFGILLSPHNKTFILNAGILKAKTFLPPKKYSALTKQLQTINLKATLKLEKIYLLRI